MNKCFSYNDFINESSTKRTLIVDITVSNEIWIIIVTKKGGEESNSCIILSDLKRNYVSLFHYLFSSRWLLLQIFRGFEDLS